jgi:membrane protease YdiL (CAAX protease family)
VAGVGAGAALVVCVALISRLAPGTLPTNLHPPSPLAALLASIAGSFGEEILCRLLILGGLIWLLPKATAGPVIAVLTSALLFGALHAPAFVMLFGGLAHIPPIAWVWLIGLNGLLGILYGICFLRLGIESAVMAHFGTDLVWHVATQVFYVLPAK